MRIADTRRLRGPNVYLARPVLVARVHLDELTERETTDHPGFADRLLAALPGLEDHHCAAGRPGGLVARLANGTYFGHVAEHVALELSTTIGREVSFGRTVHVDRGVYDVILECPRDEPPDSPVPVALLQAAIDLVEDLLAGREPGHQEKPERHDHDKLRDQYEATAPGPSTAAIADAARRRGVPVERIGELSLLRLGQGCRRRLVWAALTDATGAVGVDIAGDKQLTRRLLDGAGIPTPPGGAAATAEQALALFAELGPPVVVKPRAGRQGRHVHLGLESAAAVRAAFDAATADGGEAVVERELAGRDYRVLVVGGEVVAAAERVPAHVVGDGVASVVALVAAANADPRRGPGHARELSELRLDEVSRTVLCRQGLGPDSVPAPGRVVWLRDNANLSTGGTSRDVTGAVHPDVAALCRRVAAVVGLDVAGIDLRLPDIGVPVPPTGPGADPAGGVIEVNAAPGLRMHLHPVDGEPRDVAGDIVAMLYPDGDGRIPTVAVTGTNGKTTVARLVAHVLGRHVGLTTTDGVYVDGRLVQRADATGPRSAQVVLGDPTVRAAVLETARGGMLRQGLGYDRTDVGVITNIAPDHLGQDGLSTMDDLVDVKSLVAERVRDGGTLVLNADDPYVRPLAERPPVRAAHKRVVWFSLRPDNPLVVRHRADGGRAYLLADGWLVEACGDRTVPLLPLAALPGAFGGTARYAAANALAAAAAAIALDVPARTVADRLMAFRPWEANPGRGTLFRLGDVRVLVDYAHNPAAIAALTAMVHQVWGRSRAVLAATLPGDRRDDLLAGSARVIAHGFDRIVVYEDDDPRGRVPGEVAALVSREITAHRPRLEPTVVRRYDEAVKAALALARARDVVVVLYEKLDPVLQLLAEAGAEPVTSCFLNV